MRMENGVCVCIYKNKNICMYVLSRHKEKGGPVLC